MDEEEYDELTFETILRKEIEIIQTSSTATKENDHSNSEEEEESNLIGGELSKHITEDDGGDYKKEDMKSLSSQNEQQKENQKEKQEKKEKEPPSPENTLHNTTFQSSNTTFQASNNPSIETEFSSSLKLFSTTNLEEEEGNVKQKNLRKKGDEINSSSSSTTNPFSKILDDHSNHLFSFQSNLSTSSSDSSFTSFHHNLVTKSLLNFLEGYLIDHHSEDQFISISNNNNKIKTKEGKENDDQSHLNENNKNTSSSSIRSHNLLFLQISQLCQEIAVLLKEYHIEITSHSKEILDHYCIQSPSFLQLIEISNQFQDQINEIKKEKDVATKRKVENILNDDPSNNNNNNTKNNDEYMENDDIKSISDESSSLSIQRKEKKKSSSNSSRLLKELKSSILQIESFSSSLQMINFHPTTSNNKDLNPKISNLSFPDSSSSPLSLFHSFITTIYQLKSDFEEFSPSPIHTSHFISFLFDDYTNQEDDCDEINNQQILEDSNEENKNQRKISKSFFGLLDQFSQSIKVCFF